jgi:hypothetical protein
MLASLRRLTQAEQQQLERLIHQAELPLPSTWKQALRACPMADGGMGSLLLCPHGAVDPARRFGQEVSQWQFTDEDGVEVLASLNLDTNGELFELDVWKTDFNPLIRFPEA